MNCRLRKELRLLWQPACGAALVACLIPLLGRFSANYPGEGLFSVLRGCLGFAFFGCILIIAALPMGAEFQLRTMPLLLAQPVPRVRLWKEKLAAAALCLFGVSILALVLRILMAQGPSPGFFLDPSNTVIWGAPAIEVRSFVETDLFDLLLFVPTALCAAPLWTLVTRSTVGGVTFTLISQFLAAMVVNSISEGVHKNFAAVTPGVSLVFAAVVFCVLSLWRGWIHFFSLELAGVVPMGQTRGEGVPMESMPWWERAKRMWAVHWLELPLLDRWLSCRRAGVERNLFRKELRLLRPVYQVGMLFVLCWVCIAGLTLVQPGKGYQHLLDILIAFHVPLTFLLAGSVATSDENALGVMAWHLSLPARLGRQWAVKLVSGAGSGILVGWVLPCLAIAFSSAAVRGYSNLAVLGSTGVVLVSLSIILFVFSFWAVNLMGSVVRAVPVALGAGVVLFFAVVLGGWWARTVLGTSAWGSALEALTGAPPGSFEPLTPYVALIFVVLLLATALVQSYLIFRRPDARCKPFVVYSVVLVLGAVLMGALAAP